MQQIDDEWRMVARRVRHAVNRMAVQPRPFCLPGELQACGQVARHHVLLWAADLKAAAHCLISDTAESPDESAYYNDQYYRYKLMAFHEMSRSGT
jgi:hypothetical protein